MKILVYGECDQYGSGAWCYAETLKEMGHTVAFYSPFAKLAIYQTLCFRIQRKLTKSILPFLRKRHTLGLLKQVQILKPDIVIVLKGLLLDKTVIEKVKKEGAWTVMINHDDFFSRFRSSRSKIQFKAIPAYDYIFATKEVNVGEIKPLNKNVEFYQFAYYPRVHRVPEYVKEDADKWKSDIVFIGTAYPERRKQLEYLVQHLNRPFTLHIFGNHWVKTGRDILRPYIRGKSLGPAEMAKAIYYSKVALGFLCKENRDDYTQRTFEIPAAGGLFLAERTQRHLQYYAEGLEAVYFDADNYTELLEKVELMLDNDKLNASIRANGLARLAAGHHTYKDGLNRLLELFETKKVKVDGAV